MYHTVATGESPVAARAPGARATRLVIVETAEQLLRTMGYRKTTVTDIAHALRMSPANVYRFFPSKAAITEAVCARILGALNDRIEAVASGEGSASDRLRALFRLLQQETMALYFQERRMHDMVAAAPEQHWTVINDHVRAVQSALAGIVREGQATEEFALLLYPEVTARHLHGAMACFTSPSIIAFKFTIDDRTTLPPPPKGWRS
jgi:AcrR family transcriptional regulator